MAKVIFTVDGQGFFLGELTKTFDDNFSIHCDERGYSRTAFHNFQRIEIFRKDQPNLKFGPANCDSTLYCEPRLKLFSGEFTLYSE